jgi:small subunit ribosomal protein S6
MAQYEIAVLYHPDLEVDLSKAEDRVTKLFTDNGGKVTATDNWGKRKLAYAIKRNEHAIYVVYTVEFDPAAIQKVESTLNITDEVIRFLITKPDLKQRPPLSRTGSPPVPFMGAGRAEAQQSRSTC